MLELKYLSHHESNALKWFITRLKQDLKNELLQVKVYGSKVRGDFHDDSDVDLLVVVRERNEKVDDIIADLLVSVELEYDPHFSVVLFSEQEYNQNKAWQTPYLRNVNRDGVALI